jgi:O-antigen/teichoic acid export membrane protein
MKTKRTALNMVTDVIPLLIVSLLGIFKVKLFIEYLGNETMGLYNLFNNVMIYVSLVDGGLASAVLYSLYKPNANGDKEKINEILSGAMQTFSKIGMIVFGLAFIVSFFIIIFIKDCQFDYWYIVITFLLFSLSNVISYFFVPHKELLEVKEKKYIYNLIYQGGQIVLSITEIIMLVMGFKFAYILIMHSVVRLLAHLVEVYVCKKEFPEVKIFNKKKDFGFKKMLPSLIFHKICGLVSSNVDTIIISSFLGLGYVAIYSAYSYIITMMKNILGKLSGSMTAIIGNALVKSREKMYDLYMEFDSMLFYIATIVCVPLTLAIDGFIGIFYEGNIETSFFIAFSFCFILFSFVVKLGTTTFVNADGLYKETKHCAIVDASVNLFLSLTLVHFIGIPGVLLATAISVFIAEYGLKAVVVHKYVFNRSSFDYFVKNIKFFIIYGLDLLAGYEVIKRFNITNLGMWFLVFICFTILNALLILLIYRIFNETKFIYRVKILFKRGAK